MIFRREYLKNQNDNLYGRLKQMYLGNKISKHFFYRYIEKNEGGQFYSTTLRRIFKEQYDIDAGIGTYGCFTDGFRPHVKIGNYCSIAPGVQRLVGNHPYSNVSTHPLFYKKEFGVLSETHYDEKHLTIGNDVWIGVNAIITGNCSRIGDGAIIGAGAVVTHDVPDFSIVGGVPAKIIKYRFLPEDQKKLKDSCWWNLYPDELAKYVQYAGNVDEFVENLNAEDSNSRIK
jgi:acetyltransferase-like isoleucine patch superfamily enzyme